MKNTMNTKNTKINAESIELLQAGTWNVYPARYELIPGAALIFIDGLDLLAGVPVQVPETAALYKRIAATVAVAAETVEPEAVEAPAEIVEEAPATIEPEAEKKFFQVGYDAGVCYSVNLLWTVAPDAEKVIRAAAEKHAARHGYTVGYLKEITVSEYEENVRKGMPATEITAAVEPEAVEAPAQIEEAPAQIEEAPAATVEPEAVEAPDEIVEEAPATVSVISDSFKRETGARRAAEIDAKAEATRAVPEKSFIGSEIAIPSGKIVFDGDAQRTRIILDADAPAEIVEAVKAAGFYYSANLKSYNKKLTFKARRAALALAEELKKRAA